jgi:hypothetical protein
MSYLPEGFKMNDENREFLIADIVAMLPESKDTLWLDGLSIIGLYHLWQDLVNLTTMEATQ